MDVVRKAPGVNPTVTFLRGTSTATGRSPRTMAIRHALSPALKRYPAIAKSVDVYDSESELPFHLRREIERAGVSGQFHGVFDPLSGRVAIVSGNIPSETIAKQGFVEALLRHEGRPKGLSLAFGSARMKQAWMTQAAETIKKDVSAWLKDNNLDDTPGNRAEAAEEILVDWAKKGKIHELVDKLLAKLAEWVRSIFPDLKLTKAELRQMLARVDDWLQSGDKNSARFFGRKETAPAFARGEGRREKASISPGLERIPSPQAAFLEKIRASRARGKGDAALGPERNDETTFSRSGQSGPDVVIPAHAQRITPHSRSLDRIVGRDLRGEPFQAGTFKEVSVDALPDRGHGQVAQGVARRFGKLLRFYTAQGEALGIHGIYVPGTKTIFVDARSPLPYLHVIGHELTHHLADTAPDLYDRLVNLLAPHLDKTVYDTLYREQNDLFPPGRRADARGTGKVQQEVIANVVGEQMTKKEFWEDMAGKEPGLFRRIADWLLRQLDRLLNSFPNFERVSEKAFTDIVAVRKAVADVMAEFARRSKGHEEPGRPLYQRGKAEARPGGGYANSPAAEAATGRRARQETGAEDARESHAVKLAMPELVTLARGLLGRYPKVFERLYGRRLGSFHPGAGGTSEIKLKASNYIGMELGTSVVKGQQEADAFVDSVLRANDLKPEDVTVTTQAAPGKRLKVSIYDTDPDYAAEVLAHEIGHLIDYLPDETMARGNILGHIASLKKYMSEFLANTPKGDPPLATKDKLRLKREAARLAKGTLTEVQIDEEIEQVTGGVTPDEILSIWRDATAKEKLPPDLYNFVAGLSGAEKKAIMAQALKGLVPDQLKHFRACPVNIF